jgi:two-component system NarL family sensor kinase
MKAAALAPNGAWQPGASPLRRKIALLAVVPLIAALALIALTVRVQGQSLSASERALVEAAYLAAKEAELKSQLELAMGVVRPIYERASQPGADEAAAKAEAARILQSLRWAGGDGYFYVYDWDGINIVHPVLPELLGKNLWEERDRNGFLLVQALIAKAREGSGFVRYVWNKPSVQRVAPKLGYVVGLPRWRWMVGSGVYLDDIQATLDEIDARARDNIWATLSWIGAIALAAVGLVAAGALALNLRTYRAADAQLQLMARRVVQSQEDERAHLSRELHDGTSQTLVSIKLLMDSALARLTGAPAAQPLLEKARVRVGEALAEVRGISHRLRPAMLDALGLAAALRALGEEFAEHAGLDFTMRTRGGDAALPEEMATVLFRVAQEALTNIDKHALAARVELRLIRAGGGVRLVIVDDGIGFDQGAVDADPRRGIGLRNMRERLAAIGGRCEVVTRPGATRVIAEVPRAALARLRA